MKTRKKTSFLNKLAYISALLAAWLVISYIWFVISNLLGYVR